MFQSHVRARISRTFREGLNRPTAHVSPRNRLFIPSPALTRHTCTHTEKRRNKKRTAAAAASSSSSTGRIIKTINFASIFGFPFAALAHLYIPPPALIYTAILEPVSPLCTRCCSAQKAKRERERRARNSQGNVRFRGEIKSSRYLYACSALAATRQVYGSRTCVYIYIRICIYDASACRN